MRVFYFILFLTSCRYLGICDDSYQPGIEIVFKNHNGEFISDKVTALVFEGNYIDTLSVLSVSQSGQVLSLGGAYERPGVYALIVVSDEYETYTETGIIVRNGDCHVKLVKFEVTLDYK